MRSVSGAFGRPVHLQGMRSVSGAVHLQGMRSVSGAFGRPRNEKCLRCFWSSCRCTVHLQGMRSVSGAFGRPVGVQYTYKE